MKFDIVKGLPVPKKVSVGGNGRSSVYPFEAMELGDCIRFEAEDKHSEAFRKIYNSARSHARRKETDYDFRFARIDERHFGCWKIRKEEQSSVSRERRRRRTSAEINMIKAHDINEALLMEGTVAGAARRVGLHPKTLIRLMAKLGINESSSKQ